MSNRFASFALILAGLIVPRSGLAQGFQAPPAPGSAPKLAEQYCASCHGTGLMGGRAQSLADEAWTFGGDDKTIAESIREGRANGAMPAFKASLSERQILSLVTYIREQAVAARSRAARPRGSAVGEVVKSERHSFRMELVADGLDTPWGIDFLPDGRLVVTERPGRLRFLTPGQPLSKPITGLPAVWARQDGGLMDVALHPDYAKNGWIYLSFADPAGHGGASMTEIVRGRVRDGAWVDQEVLYKAASDLYWADDTHFGSRFLFDKARHLFYSIGDRGHQKEAQDLTRSNGKIHRVNDDGSIPKDNPFVGKGAALASIWSYGNRNPQGLAFHPVTGAFWESEHGPRGGDELNRIEPGKNYGWPVITHGIDYDGTPITDKTEAPGMEQPITQWTPSLGTCAIAFYTGDKFPGWKNDLFLATLVGQQLRRIVLNGDKVVQQEIVIANAGRVREVATGPDGYLYVAFNDPGRIVRLVPTDPPSR